MTPVRELIRELHRRSVWQVLGIYLFGSWMVLQVVDVLAQNVGLPAWTFPFAVVLLLIGLPVVLATAFVQEGLAARSGQQSEANQASTAADGGAAAAAQGITRDDGPAARARVASHRIFTWRNAGLGGIAAFALWGVVAAAYFGTTRVGEPGDPETTLAVLPFQNQGDPGDAYFADGMADDVRSRLAAVPRLRVIAHGSVERFRASDRPPEEIARELGATHLLTARVRWDRSAAGPSRVRVTPELVEVGRDGRASVLWQSTFDAVLQDVFRVQTEIATRVSQGLDVIFGARERERLANRPTENLAAYDAYLRGLELVRRPAASTIPERRRAVELFERAVALDPHFAEAWAELSRTLSGIYVSIQTVDVRERARESAERASALQPERPAGYVALADYYSLVENDAARAAGPAERALQYGPQNPDLLTIAASLDLALGNAERAIQRLDLARTVDPLNLRLLQRRVRTLITLRRYDQALAEAERILAADSTSLNITQWITVVHLARGDSAAARAFLREVAHRFDPGELAAYFGLYLDLYWVLGDEQQRLLLSLPPSAADDDRGAWALIRAQLYAHRGDMDLARAWGDTAAAEFAAQIRQNPETPTLSVFRGLALAYAGRGEEAVTTAERGVAPLRAKQSEHAPYYEWLLTRVYILTGRHEAALELLPSLLGPSYFLSPGWLRVDPNFDPIRAHPRFRQLAEAS